MTRQLLMSNRSATISRSQTKTSNSQMVTTQALSTTSARKEAMNSIYQADQQVKFLHLQAEVETLLLELQTLKQHRLSASTQDAHRLPDAAHDSN